MKKDDVLVDEDKMSYKSNEDSFDERNNDKFNLNKESK